MDLVPDKLINTEASLSKRACKQLRIMTILPLYNDLYKCWCSLKPSMIFHLSFLSTSATLMIMFNMHCIVNNTMGVFHVGGPPQLNGEQGLNCTQWTKETGKNLWISECTVFTPFSDSSQEAGSSSQLVSLWRLCAEWVHMYLATPHCKH